MRAVGIDQAEHDRAVARLVAAALDQGLGPTITDPDTLDHAAVLWRAGCEANENSPITH